MKQIKNSPIKTFLCTLLAFLCLVTSNSGQAAENFSHKDLSLVPILHEGRIKPLDTFANSFLLSISGRTSINGLSSIEWLVELLFNAPNSYTRNIFYIPSSDVKNAIGLEKRKGHRYNFNEVSEALRNNIQTVNALHQKTREELSLAQDKLVELYLKTLWYFDISRSLSLILPQFVVRDSTTANTLSLEVDKVFTYLEMLQKKDQFLTIIQPLVQELTDQPERKSNLTAQEKELLQIGIGLQKTGNDSRTQSLKIIPPLWKENAELWVTPWGSLQQGQSSPESAILLDSWKAMAVAFLRNDWNNWNQQAKLIKQQTYTMMPTYISPPRLYVETIYNKLNAFKFSLVFYLLGFICVLTSFLTPRISRSRQLALILLVIGSVFHLLGVILRIYIMSRPPVSTLYESVLFVGLVGVLCCVLLEMRRQDGLSTIIGTGLGSVLQFIGIKYSLDGDTMGMLVAVLNTNFWLATHVTVITMGYAFCYVAGTMAHIYLGFEAFASKKFRAKKQLEKNMLGVSLIALFFSLFGTILGGIWADQSWGRFWGWDPKENGALLIVLWLIMALHGRISGVLKPLYFAVTIGLLNIVVALAWFGVNLLNIGLHSYGFTQNIAFNLALFVGIELLAIAGLYSLCLYRNKKQNKKHLTPQNVASLS